MASELQTYGITKFMGLIKDYVDVEVDPGYASIAQDIDWRSDKGAMQGAKTHTQFHDRATAVYRLRPV